METVVNYLQSIAKAVIAFVGSIVSVATVVLFPAPYSGIAGFLLAGVTGVLTWAKRNVPVVAA